MPKISIVIPVYNVEKYLPKCLDSVLAQTFTDWEAICVNDGSPDKCADILAEYAQKDKRILTIHQPNGGYGRAVNHGIEVATGEYIGIVEPDDWVDTNMFETLYQKAIETDADFVKADFYRYSGRENKSKIAHIIPNEVSNLLIEPIKYSSVMNITPSIWSAIYKKDFLTNNNIRLLETPGASYQDTGFHFKTLLSTKKAYFLDQPFYQYRIDNMGSSVKDTKKIFCVCDEWAEIIRWAKEKGNYNQIVGLLCALQYKIYMWNWKRLSNEGKKQFLKRFSEDFIAYDEQDVLKKENFKTKDYQRLKQIMFHPKRFEILYVLKHLPNILLRKLKRRING